VADELRILDEVSAAEEILEMVNTLQDKIPAGFYPPGVVMKKRPWPGGMDGWVHDAAIGDRSIWGGRFHDQKWLQTFNQNLREDTDFICSWKVKLELDGLDKWFGCPKYDAKIIKDKSGETQKAPTQMEAESCITAANRDESITAMLAGKKIRVNSALKSQHLMGVSNYEIDRRMLLLFRNGFLEFDPNMVQLVAETYPRDSIERGKGSARKLIVLNEPAKLLEAWGEGYDPSDIHLSRMPPLAERWLLLLLHTVPSIPERLEVCELLDEIPVATGILLQRSLTDAKLMEDVVVEFHDSEAALSIEALFHGMLACANYVTHDDKKKQQAVGFSILDFHHFLKIPAWKDNRGKWSLIEAAIKHVTRQGVKLSATALEKLQMKLKKVISIDLGRATHRIKRVYAIYDRLETLLGLIEPAKPCHGEAPLQDMLPTKIREAIAHLKPIMDSIDPDILEKVYRTGTDVVINFSKGDDTREGEEWLPMSVELDNSRQVVRSKREKGPAVLQMFHDVYSVVKVIHAYSRKLRAYQKAATGLKLHTTKSCTF